MQTSPFVRLPEGPRRQALKMLAVVVGAAAIAPILARATGPEPVPYPDGFRSWAHVKTALVTERHTDFASAGGFRHIYANPAAVAGYRSGTYADGSAIVVDWLQGREENGAFTEGVRQRVDVMVKDRTRFAATGGWGFERFKGDSRTERSVTSPAEQCYACHAKAPDGASVFSKLRE